MNFNYFKDEEVHGLDIKLVQMLDRARGLAEIPFKITSGYRTPQDSIAVGGTGDDAHTHHKAADIRCNDSVSRLKIISALILVGFKRIGIKKDHIHADVDTTLPQNVMWLE